MSTRIVLTDDLLRRMLEARASNGISEDRLADELALEIARMPQRRPGVDLRSGWLTRSIAVASVALVAVAAVAAIALVGIVWRPVVHVIDVGDGATAAPVLPGGRYRSAVFEPSLTFTAPDGVWGPVIDLRAELQLRAVRAGTSDDSGSLTVVRVDNVMTGPCGYQGNMPWPASGDPASFMAWLKGQLPTGLGATRPIEIGGRAGLEADFKATIDVMHECDFGFLLTDIGTEGSPSWVEIPVDGRVVRLMAVQVSGKLLVFLLDERYAGFNAEADALLASLAFD